MHLYVSTVLTSAGPRAMLVSSTLMTGAAASWTLAKQAFL